MLSNAEPIITELQNVDDTALEDSPVSTNPIGIIIANEPAMQKPDVKLSTCVDGVNDEVEYWMPTKPLSDSADFVLTPQVWDLIFSSVQGR